MTTPTAILESAERPKSDECIYEHAVEAGRRALAEDLPYGEFDARRMMGAICAVANLRRPRWLDPSDFFNLIDDGDTTGIPADEMSICQETALALTAVSKADGSRQYALVECAAGITRAEIYRSRRNADYLARITGCVVHAVIVGRTPPDDILDTARECGVHCLEPTRRTSF